MAFPAAWTALHALTAWSGARAMDAAPPAGARSGSTSASTIELTRRAGAHDRAAAAGLAPYVAPHAFAGALDAEIVRRAS